MARKMTPAQIRAALQKAQRDSKRAIDDYNREVRKYNAAVEKAVDNYNQEVRNYNSKARAHNRQVESQRRRLNQEIIRMNSGSTTTTWTAYRASTATLVQAYNTVESDTAASPASPAIQRFVNLASDETANSVYLINALDGDGAPEDDPTEDELRAPSLTEELAAFGEDLVRRWTGALYALSPHNPDAARHFCTSAREVVISILDNSAPDTEVRESLPDCETTNTGVPTRRSKINYLLLKRNLASDAIANLVDEDVENLLSLFRTFNDGTHGHAGRFTVTELAAIRTRVEAAISFIHQLVSGPSATHAST